MRQHRRQAAAEGIGDPALGQRQVLAIGIVALHHVPDLIEIVPVPRSAPAAAAQERMRTNQHFGKIALVM